MRATLQKRGFWRNLAFFVLPLLPVIYLLSLVAKYGVNVPYADEFTLAPLLVKAHEHTINFSDLFRQHNEHRYFFPRLLFIAFAYFSHGDVRAEMFFSALLAGFTAITLWVVIRRTITGSIEKALALAFLVNLLLFSPVQAENWVWGFQFVLLLCNFLFACGLLVAISSLNVWKKYVLCAVLAIVSTFSFGGGVLLWALTFPIALSFEPAQQFKRSACWLFAWVALGTAVLCLYFVGFRHPAQVPGVAVGLLDYYLYVTTFVGAHLWRADRTEAILPAALIGTVLLALYGAAALYLLRYVRDSSLRKRMIPWLTIGAYAFLSACLAAVARIGFGVNQGLDSRYTSFSLYLSVAAIGLVAIVANEIRLRPRNKMSTEGLARVETGLLTGFILLTLVAFSWGQSLMAQSQRTRLWGKGALLFSNVLDDGTIHDKYLMAEASQARMFANMEDSIGLFHPSMLRSAEISKLNTESKLVGYLDYLTVEGQTCKFVGWATLPKRDRPADCVVLSYETPGQGNAIAFRVADETQERLDVARALHSTTLTACGWICHFDRSLVPPGDHLIRAWAFDAKRATLYPLDTPIILH
jgi:hypothetical protein